MTYNFDNLDDSNSFAIEDLLSNAYTPGLKALQVTELKSGKSRTKETPYVRFHYRILTSEAPSEVGGEGQFDRFLSDKALKILARELHGLGLSIRLPRYNGQDPEGFAAAMATYLEGIVGTEIQAEFSIRVGDDKVKRNDIRLLGSNAQGTVVGRIGGASSLV